MTTNKVPSRQTHRLWSNFESGGVHNASEAITRTRAHCARGGGGCGRGASY